MCKETSTEPEDSLQTQVSPFLQLFGMTLGVCWLDTVVTSYFAHPASFLSLQVLLSYLVVFCKISQAFSGQTFAKRLLINLE